MKTATPNPIPFALYTKGLIWNAFSKFGLAANSRTALISNAFFQRVQRFRIEGLTLDPLQSEPY